MSEENAARLLANAKKRRGVARASLTRLSNRLKELDGEAGEHKTLELAQRMLQKLTDLDSEFRSHHHSLVDLIDDEETLAREQDVLDTHDDLIAELTVRVKQIIATLSPSSSDSSRKIVSRKLTHLQKSLASVVSAISDMSSTTSDTCLLRQYEERTNDVRKDLAKTRDDLHHMELDESDELFKLQDDLESQVFDCSVNIKKLLYSDSSPPEAPSAPVEGKGVKLPKLDVPTFDGNILHWQSFWDQFRVSVHDRAHLSDAEKLVYLQQSLKGASAKGTIEGLSRSGDCYTEAIECLKARYNRPRLIHQTHVRMIIEAPPIKEGNGKELRRLHDTVQQHLRALKAMGCEAPGPFITSVLELKLDQNTMFEWHKHSQEHVDVPHYNELLDFINLRAQASESLPITQKRQPHSQKPVTSFTANATPSPNCVVCKTEKHPLYACSWFKLLSHDQKLSTVRTNGLCMNCLKPGHFLKQCKSLHHCKTCQKPHHTLLHVESSPSSNTPPTNPSVPHQNTPPTNLPLKVPRVSSNTAAGLTSHSLLMTCRVFIQTPDGSTVSVRALLDSASSASFVSERLVKSLCLPRLHQTTTISGVAGLRRSSLNALTNLSILSSQATRKFNITAIVVPRVTCDLPVHPVSFGSTWNHLKDLPLADPSFGRPGRIDLLLGVDIFTAALLNGRRVGPPGTPTAFETVFGWVLAGSTGQLAPETFVNSHHTLTTSCDDLLRRFWEVEENMKHGSDLSPEERSVVQHFHENHRRAIDGRFIVPLPKKPHAPLLGESRSQAVRRFLSLERSLCAKDEFEVFDTIMQEYLEMKHAEPVPTEDLEKPQHSVFYLPMHAVKKESSTTTKIRAVFDASAKSSSNTSLNDILLVGPTVHSPLIDVLLRFRLHRIALTADVSKMYRAIELIKTDRDLHRFVWRSKQDEPLRDYRMTRVTFGVSASSFAANMSVKQNAIDHALEFPKAADAVERAFYVDDCLAGADSVEEAICLHQQLLDLFTKGGFLLRKWSSSDPAVSNSIPLELRATQSTHHIPSPEEYTKTLGIEWNASLDHFRLTVASLPATVNVTKRTLISDIAKIFDVLGWFSPSIIKAKILLQRLWESKIGWDDMLPPVIHQTWQQWTSELHLLAEKHIPRCYYPKDADVYTVQLHGFCDASEDAYAGVVYFRMQDTHGNVHLSLVVSKTKVAPIKRLTIPRLELCGAQLLARLLHHTKQALNVPTENTYAWTDSTIVLSWLIGNPRRFKTFVGNRVSHVVQLIPPDRWSHVNSADNPADCASRGLFPSELVQHGLWWNAPHWLRLPSTKWPTLSSIPSPDLPPEEERELCLHTVTNISTPIIPLEQFSSFLHLKRVTAWVLRFIHNCRRKKQDRPASTLLSTAELMDAEIYWTSLSQQQSFTDEIEALKNSKHISNSSCLFSLRPFLDASGLLRVGGRGHNAQLSYSIIHPIILSGKHPITSLLISSEHRRLMHAGPTLLTASLNRRYYITGCRRIVRSITRGCVTCRRTTAKPKPQLFGQLPAERITPDYVFDHVGLDYAGPFMIKHGPSRKPTLVKAYVCVFVSLSIKAVHLELASDLTTDAFIAALRRFIARRGKPSLIWSDHGTNFVGAVGELKEFVTFFQNQKTQGHISEFCSAQNIRWKFIPEHTPHFGGLWEAAVKSMKSHLKRVVGETKLTFEEFMTVLTQVEACLNSRPLVPIVFDGDTVEPLTPGHFLIGRPIEALPDPSTSYQSISLLRRWHLCQNLTRHFWKRWSTEYLGIIRKYVKWHHPSRNMKVGDVVILQEDNLFPTKWPIGRIVDTHPGKDGFVRILTIKTSKGIYKRPVTKIALLLPDEN